MDWKTCLKLIFWYSNVIKRLFMEFPSVDGVEYYETYV